MKNLLCFFILFHVVSTTYCNQLEQLSNALTLEVNEIKLTHLKSNQLAISMPFASKLILNPEQKKAIEEKIIIKIELVYTKFKTSPLFNQQQLNYERLVELKKLNPTIFENPLWDFSLISQTSGNSSAECDKMFHGFILTFRPNSNTTTLALEADYLNKVVDKLTKKDTVLDKLNYELKTRWDNQIGYVHDTIWKIDEDDEIPLPDFFYDPSLFKDTTVISAFNRNTSWKNFIVVTDVTGSMSPYIAQVFTWIKTQTNNLQAKYFVFFNDGDDKESRKKKPLETGGIYGCKNTGLEIVMQTTAKCMKNGSGGGEGLENDVEAIVFGQQEYAAADEIVLVADNLESMRDYKFISEIKKPVHIIICGAISRINIEYLDLARATNGSIHTTTSDIQNLNGIKNNQTITIDDKNYLFYNERFNFVY